MLTKKRLGEFLLKNGFIINPNDSEYGWIYHTHSIKKKIRGVPFIAEDIKGFNCYPTNSSKGHFIFKSLREIYSTIKYAEQRKINVTDN